MKGIFSFVFCLLVASLALGENVKVDTGRASADIFWDTWGVPHIYADTFESLSYAFGYAQARDHGMLFCRMMFFSTGKAAETRRIYAPFDKLMYTIRIKQFSDMYYEKQDPESITALENFALGFNAFAEEHPEFFEGDFASILPVSGIDVFRANIRVLYTFAFAKASSLKDGFEAKYGKDPLLESRLKEENVIYGAYENHDPLEGLGIDPELRHMIGSNGWAINSRSGRSDGKPKLNQNPHLPYYAFFRWYEAQLVCESCDINVYGASLIGIPNLQIAFNDYIGWTHTVNPMQPFTGYVVDLASEDSYYYDGEVLPITREEVTYRVKQIIGYKTVTVINEFTIHGQVIARSANQILVKRLAGFDDELRPDAIKQWWDMGRAKSMEEFKAVMRQLQVPMFYTIATSRDDDIMLNFNGWVPDRKGQGDWNYWAVPVNGSTSETFWDSVHPWDELPTIENPPAGFVQNANEAPWTASFPIFTLNPDDYPAYVAPSVYASYRSQASMRLVSTSYNITFDDFVALKHSAIKEAAIHTLDELLAAAAEFGESDLVKQAAAVLASWDRMMDTTSRGSDLFNTWLRRNSDRTQLYVNQWDPLDPLNTPNTLKDPSLAVADLEAAAQTMLDKGIALDSQYGDNNRLFAGSYMDFKNTLPGNGCGDCFRSSYYILGLSHGGDSYVCIVEWDKVTGPHAQSLMGFGNASPGASSADKHVNDQNALFSEKKLRDVWRTKEEALANLEEHVLLTI